MRLTILFILISISVSAQKTYQKTFFENGTLKSEGWLEHDRKVDYWKFYYNNGTLQKEGHFINNNPGGFWFFYSINGNNESEGHYVNGQKRNWWRFYNNTGQIINKCQFLNDVKHGICLLYKGKKIVKAIKYENGVKIKEWTDLKAFKKENKLSDLK